MTREEILSIEGIEQSSYLDEFLYGDIAIIIDADNSVQSIYHNNEKLNLKPILDIETLKQFLNFFDI